MDIAELKNSISGTKISAENIKTIWKDHIKSYWINSPGDYVDLKLDIIGDETLNADCDVTDNYVESNTAYQDQITLKPITFTVSGEVGELVWYQSNSYAQRIGQVAQKLEGVISFLPVRSKSFNQMKKTVMKAAQWVDTASNVLSRLSSLVGGSGFIPESMSRQQQAYQLLVLYRNMRKPLTIKSPWGVLQNYVITNLEFKQPKETKDKSLITITFKEFRLVSIQTVPFDSQKYQGNAAFENQPRADQGKTDGQDASLETVDDPKIEAFDPNDDKDIISNQNKKDTCEVRYDNKNYYLKDEQGALHIYDSSGKPMLDENTGYGVLREATQDCDDNIRRKAEQELGWWENK